MSETNPHGWLTAKRLRAHGAILALCLWSVCLWNYSTPTLRDRSGNLKGTDFLHLYVLGSLAADHRGADLYNTNAQAALTGQRVPEAAGIRYLPLYPPQVSLLFAPLSRLSYGWALVVWWIFCAGVYGACCYSIWRVCPQLRDHAATVCLLAFAFPAFFHLIAWGQTSALGLACFTLMFLLMRDRRNFLAGVALGCLIFKPQLGLAAGVLFVCLGRWKIVAGAVLSAAAQLSLGVLFYGAAPLRTWAQRLIHVRDVLSLLEPKPYQTHSLRTFWSMLLPRPGVAFGLYIMSALVVLGLTVVLWRQDERVPLALRYSTLLIATVLVAPHLTVYDLVILAPAFLLLADRIVGHSSQRLSRNLGTALYFVYVLPLLGPLATWTHVQLSVIAMTAVLILIWRISVQPAMTDALPVGK